MTTNRISDPLPAINAVADLFFEVENPLLFIESLAVLIAPSHLNSICERLDLCPIHLTDLDTCFDDELDCRGNPDD